jgi:CRISPR-associated endonuclease Csn1
MNNKVKIPSSKTTSAQADLQLAFDVGHSSLGWAVLQTPGKVSSIDLLGCGVVTFGADDCLASQRRGKRRERRHTRATRQRIARMETLLMRLGVFTSDELERLHAPAKGNTVEHQHERRGFSFPWLLACRVLAARTDDEKRKAKLNWHELWDVLRWYAHNRGYDGNIRWSGGFRVEAFSDVPMVSKTQVTEQATAAKEKGEGGDEDWKKLEAAAARMSDYGFNSPTYAETVAKFLLGPQRNVTPGQPGKPGAVEPTKESFSEEQFRKLLFNCDPGFENHPRHLSNYFKGLRVAFPRRIIKSIDGKPTLVGGTEWELRYILRAHFGDLKECDESFEKIVCSGIPEADDDWQVYAKMLPDMYLSEGEHSKLQKLRIPRKMPKAEKKVLAEKRREILKHKLALPARYRGGLLFGQLVPRFDNRIIGTCPVNREKVPGRNCPEFLNFRWAMTVANLRVGFGNEIYDNNEKLRPLNAVERGKLDAAVRKLGFLKLEKDKPDASGFVREGKNELKEILVKEIKCDRHSLEDLLLLPDAKESLKLVPIEGSTTAFRLVWGLLGDPRHDAQGSYHDAPLRSRFTIQLLRQKKLTLNEIVRQLEGIEHKDIAEQIQTAARAEASDRRGKLDEEKLTGLMAAEFFCPKLKGRARFSRKKLREAVQQVFHKEKPVHPLEKGGCLEQTETIKEAAINEDLAGLTNNHLVRHRLLILAGDEKGKPEPKEGLLQHIIKEFAGADKRRIGRITIELARDLQEMSGMTNKEKAKELTMKLSHHQEVSEDLAKKLQDDHGNPLRDPKGRPYAASPGMIRKARILDDLENRCPYTGYDIEFIHLAKAHPRFGTADKDHVVPRSQRLSDALEAQVITFSEINQLKGQRTALQFVRDMNLLENKHHKERFGFKTEAQFRRDVDALWPVKDPFKRARAGGPKATSDESRCWRRKELLLKATWTGKEFTPADLAKTRHTVKLAAQKLESYFCGLPKEHRPPVIAVTGSVTASFRDKTWKLLGELAAVNPAIKEALEKGAKQQEQGKDFNPKKAVRELSHLHHALDAVALALVTHKLVPPNYQSLDGELARLIVKGKLTVDRNRERPIDELASFRSLCARLGLPKFYQIDSKNRLHIEDLDPEIKKQIRTRLSEMRVVQHIPADMRGMKVEENTRSVLSTVNGKHELNPPHDRGALPSKKLVGLEPNNGNGKLKPQRGVRVITDNFGVAILDNNPAKRFEIIPWFKIWPRIYEGFGEEKSLVEQNGGKPPRILRNGMLIRIGKFRVLKPTRVLENSIWAVDSIGDFDGVIKIDLKPSDVVRTRYETIDPKDPTGEKTKKSITAGCKLSTDLERVYEGGLEILKTSLTGIPVCPITSSA